MAPKPRPDAENAPRRPGKATVDGSTAEPREARREGDGALETYEQEVERASVDSLAEHPEGSAPPLERLVDADPEKKKHR